MSALSAVPPVNPQVAVLSSSTPHKGWGAPESVKNVLGYLASVALTAACVIVAMRLWAADLTVPFNYGFDSLLHQVLIQATMENGWYFTNGRLGMPSPQTLYDFPMADSLHFIVIKLLGYIIPNSAVVLNLYSLLPFPLVALTSYFVLRRFKVARLLALVASVLYACSPFHFFRCTSHVFLAAYYLLPLITWLLVRLYLGKLPFVHIDLETGKRSWRFLNWEAAGAVVLCFLTGMSGIYYVFFSCFLLLAVGIKVAFRERRWVPLIASGALIGVTCTGVVVCVAPSIVYRVVHGKNSLVGRRAANEADLYGLECCRDAAASQGASPLVV